MSSARTYESPQRARSAEATRRRILEAARALFATRGIEPVTIAAIARRARVASPTVYANYRSKEGLLRALLQQTLFGPRFAMAMTKLAGVDDPVERIALTAEVAGAIYDDERAELGLLRGAAAFSPALRRIEDEFEALRYAMQEERIERLFAAGRQKPGLNKDEARRLLWMYTSRDVYRMLVMDGGWTPERYRQWLARSLVAALVQVRRSASGRT